MEERKYDFYDVKQFLKEQYDIDWKGFNIYDIDKIRKVKLSDIKGEHNYLRVGIPVLKNNHKDSVVVEVTNYLFNVISSNNPRNDKSQIWQAVINDKEHSPKY